MVLKKILRFCEKYEEAGAKVAFFLIALQIVHLAWLTTDIVLVKLDPTRTQMFPIALEPLQAVVDYLEIPGLFAGVSIYVMSIMRKDRNSVRNMLFTAMLIIQFVHLFWITDEVVYQVLLKSDLVEIPDSVAWVAIMIDYLEIPVMFDMFGRAFKKK